ncbi:MULTISPECIES: SDR family oxidoreductase [unclassified Mycobacterium]|uniref:SDR family oxidoreductase n=1 Tax=unclassified Mycobacterium TaxID=2642494 RepID=UPI0007FF8904|nr:MULTISPECIES: NAD(P)H-binding protein [unclassified Mycobacterium]OBG71919.1 NmrA family protein [Mycobacterium sp. E1214]OBH24929.1 NmrA family protein [Mycobacterium sp. E1319]
MTTIAVLGATGTAGSRVVARLRSRDVAVVEISRAQGVDVVSGANLSRALDGVDVAIDVTNPTPPDIGMDIAETLVTAARNIVNACVERAVRRLVAATMAGIEDPAFDGYPYCEAKRAAKDVLLDGPVPTTIVKSTHWYEFATNADAVNVGPDEVVVEDWLIQPIAADTVADVLVEAALGQTHTPRAITGPHTLRLPELTAKVLALQGDTRPVRPVQPAVAALGGGALLASGHAVALGPDIDGWLSSHAAAGPAAAPASNGAKGTRNLDGAFDGAQPSLT